MNLHEDLKRKIAAAGFTVTAVCIRAGVSTGTPAHWNAGNSAPNQSTYNKMVVALAELIAEREEAMKSAGLKKSA